MLLAPLAATTVSPDRAILISVVSGNDMSPANDCSIVREALLRRGCTKDQIRSVAIAPGSNVAAQIQEAFSGLATAAAGTVFVYVSADGTVDGLEPSAAQGMRWQRLLTAMSAHNQLRFEVIGDTGYTNLLTGMHAKNVSIAGVGGTWRDRTQKRATGLMGLSNHWMQAGVLSTIVARELPYATTFRDLAERVSRYKESGSMGAIWFNAPTLQIFGDGSWAVPGHPIRL